MILADRLLERNRIDDVVGAVPVHAVAGVWGTLAVALFGDLTVLNTGLSRPEQFVVQLGGAAICFLWSFFIAFLALRLIAPHVSLRVSLEDERIGLNVAEHGATTEMLDLFTAMDHQAATGDLSLRAPVEPFTEVGQIAQRYNSVLDRLAQARRDTEDVVRRATDVIIRFSGQVDSNAQTVSQGVDHLRKSIHDISTGAAEVARKATQAVRVADSTNSTVRKLGASSQEISEIIKVITSIARKTNLLALNATIEAARAGDAGKGFAVVANAVKDLSHGTAQATEDIAKKIGAIQADAQSTVAAINEIGRIIAEIDDYQSRVESQAASTTKISQDVAAAAQGSVETARNITAAAQVARKTTADDPNTRQPSAQNNGINGLEKLVEQIQVTP